MYSPIPHDLTIYDGKFDFEKYGYCPYQWEISVPQRNCIIWSVVLSHLRSADFGEPGKFEERLNQLTKKIFDTESVKSAILGFNPFFNIHKCFFDETLKKVNTSFKKLLDENRPSTGPKSVPRDMQMISTLLKSNILIVDLKNQSLHLITPSDDHCPDVATITLFCREHVSKDKNQVLIKRFTFSLNKDLCWQLRRDAFDIILESPEMKNIAEKEIQSLTEKEEKRINILITLLKKDFSLEICKLCDSPYTMAKLADAGFETNPMVSDTNGLSAFYYALLSNNKNLVYLLHNYAVNNCNESGTTFRDPDSQVLGNLLQLQKIIQDDRIKSQNFKYSNDKVEKTRLASEELQRFNEFLIKICEGIQDLRTQPKNNTLQEAIKIKKIIVHILEVYNEFFSFNQMDGNVTGSELLENYTTHKAFCDNLDFTVSLLFFDNIFLLKELSLPPQPRLYLDLESKFILSIITNEYFCANIQGMPQESSTDIENKDLKDDSGILHIFSLLERLSLRESIRTFCKIFKEKELTQEDIIDSIPTQEISDIMTDFTEVKDEFLVLRLSYYLNSALDSDPDDFKQKFIIQRALQVIGESVDVETEQPTSIKFLLRSCLPNETVCLLTQYKNILSHIKNYQFPLKFEIEQDDDLFRSIQLEIRTIKEALVEAFDIHKVRFLEFLFNRRLETLREYQQTPDIAIFNNDPSFVKTTGKLGETLLKIRTEFLIFSFNFYMGTVLGIVLGSLVHPSFVIQPALKVIDELISIEKEYTSSIRYLFRESSTNETLTKVLNEARSALSRLQLFQFPLKPKTEKDEILFRSVQSEIQNIQNTFEEIFDFQKVRWVEVMSNRSVGSLRKFQQHGGVTVFSNDKKNVQKRSTGFEGISVQKEANKHYGSISNINKLCRKLKGFASSSKKDQIREEVPQEVKNRLEAITKLEQDLEKGITVDIERFDSLFLNRKDLCSIKKDYENYSEEEEELSKSSKRSSLLYKIRKAPNPTKILDLIFEEKKVSDSQISVLYEAIDFSDESKAILNSLTENFKSPCTDNLGILLDRIKHLYQITIEEKYDIRFLWERAKSSQAKQYLVHKIVQRYLCESSFRVSLEMLLFDCMAILKNNDDSKPFWIKTSCLFNGIDIRNVLTQREPLLECIGQLLDPKDIPSELVKKMLQFLEDRDCIEALIELQQKIKGQEIISKYYPECHKLKERVCSCCRWQDYCKLLADDPMNSDAYVSIISFLENSFQPKWKKGKN